METINAAELVGIYRHIKAHPEEWDQVNFGLKTLCGTAYCVAGHAVVRAGGRLVFDDDELATDDDYNLAWEAYMPDGRERTIADAAREILGLNRNEAGALFYANNSLEDIRNRIIEFTGCDPEEPLPDLIAEDPGL